MRESKFTNRILVSRDEWLLMARTMEATSMDMEAIGRAVLSARQGPFDLLQALAASDSTAVSIAAMNLAASRAQELEEVGPIAQIAWATDGEVELLRRLTEELAIYYHDEFKRLARRAINVKSGRPKGQKARRPPGRPPTVMCSEDEWLRRLETFRSGNQGCTQTQAREAVARDLLMEQSKRGVPTRREVEKTAESLRKRLGQSKALRMK